MDLMVVQIKAYHFGETKIIADIADIVEKSEKVTLGTFLCNHCTPFITHTDDQVVYLTAQEGRTDIIKCLDYPVPMIF